MLVVQFVSFCCRGRILRWKIKDPGCTVGRNLQPGLHFFQSGLNPGDPGVKLNSGRADDSHKSAEFVSTGVINASLFS